MTEPTSDQRTRIIEAALRVVSEGGVRQLTSTQVAREAGLRQSHLTYYFPTARDLRQAVMQHFVEGMLARVRAAAEGGKREGLRELHRLVTDPHHMRLLSGLAVEAEADEELRLLFAEALEQFDAAVAAMLGRTARDPAIRQLVATLWGLGLRRLLTREKPKPGEVDRLLQLLDESPAPASRRKS